MTAPLVRTRDGAIIGIDWRQTGESEVTVPGLIEARHVMPGDVVREVGMDVIVTARRFQMQGRLELVHVIGETRGGTAVSFEHEADDLVHVIRTGAFE